MQMQSPHRRHHHYRPEGNFILRFDSSNNHNNHKNNNNNNDDPLLYRSPRGFHEMLDDEEEPQPVSAAEAHGPIAPPAIASGPRLRELLIQCAESVSRSDWQSAGRIISLLSRIASPAGDSAERLVCQFARALSRRHPALSASAPSSGESGEQEIMASYLSLNQVTPFVRFAHLTANQAILEALEGVEDSVHIVDFNIVQGLQWPPLMQALAERGGGPPRLIRMTGTGLDLETLRKTGRRLERFAQSLGLRFEFRPLRVEAFDDLDLSRIEAAPGESLAVNCVLHLHKLPAGGEEEEGEKEEQEEAGEGRSPDRAPRPRLRLRSFLEAIKNLEPKVVTLAEREADHDRSSFMERFMEALNHYSALFDSLEATLPPKSQERLNVEQVWLAREIADIVSCEGSRRTERHRPFDHWMRVMNECGFSSLPLSPFALSQARLLLRLHYPSEGYQLQLLNNAFFLGWQQTQLFSVSSWH